MTRKCFLNEVLPVAIGLIGAAVVFLPILRAPNVSAGEPAKTESTSTTTTTTATEPAQKQIKGGSQLWSENCARCHNMRSPSNYSDAEWEVAMHHMRIRGRLTAEEHKAILEFLKSAN